MRFCTLFSCTHVGYTMTITTRIKKVRIYRSDHDYAGKLYMYYRDNSSRMLSPEDGFNSFLLTGVQYACLHFFINFSGFCTFACSGWV